MTEYMMLTNIWNEETQIPKIVANIESQTFKPSLWFWIDDGSSNGSYNEIINAKTDIPIKIMQIDPPKDRGNLDTLGHAHSRALPEIKRMKFDYLATVDVDNVFPPDYFEKMIRYMDHNPDIGTLAAQSKNDPLRNISSPMGGGKITRWIVLESIDEYWDLAPDTFLNIKAQSIGLRSVSLQTYFIEAPPTALFSHKGRLRYGRGMYYVGRPVVFAIWRAIQFLIKRDHGTQFLRGYCQEWSRGSWRCKDPDIRYFYSAKRKVRSRIS